MRRAVRSSARGRPRVGALGALARVLLDHIPQVLAEIGRDPTGPRGRGYRSTMTTTPQDPSPDAEPEQPGRLDDPGESPIPGEKRTPGADEDDPEYEHESPRRVHGGEPA